MFRKNRTGRAEELWPVLLLLVVVAIPTLVVLWFAGIAMENQTLASQQQLTNFYRLHLDSAQRQITSELNDLLAYSASKPTGSDSASPQEQFADLVRNVADAAVTYDANGAVLYPDSRLNLPSYENELNWIMARQRENIDNAPSQAAILYAEISDQANSDLERISARQAQIRCLFKSDQAKVAAELINRMVETGQLESLSEQQARSIAANIQLMVIERLHQTHDVSPVVNLLLDWVHRYNANGLSSPQRLFLMKQLSAVAPDRIDRQLLNAEDLSGKFVATHAERPKSDGFRPSQLDQLWFARSADRRAAILLHESTLRERVLKSAQASNLPEDADIDVLSPNQEASNTALVVSSAGPNLPGWRISLTPQDVHLLDATARQRKQLYFWIGALVILFTSVLAIIVVSTFRRQIRLANFKNDLVGTVSHELKTPLSSMRLLVDTLIASEKLDESVTREYLTLIAKENTRLSRLIENFLTFTRIDQDQHRFQFEPITASQIIASAIDAAGDRFEGDNCNLTIEPQGEHEPALVADKDSLVTVLLNLLDNAYKYSHDSSPREISIRTNYADDAVSISVSDNGVGLSRAAMRKIFQRFYQVDQSLARDGGGCGLGLSIVDAIVKAHRGSVGVTSKLGKGSTFTFTIPTSIDSAGA